MDQVLPFFSNRLRTELRPSRYCEPTFEYLDVSARPSAGAIRGIVEDWLSRYPANHITDLIKRMRSPEKAEPAFFELYIHELLRQLGLEPLVQPLLPRTPKRPDFAIRQGNQKIIVEAAWMGEGDSLQRAAQRVLDDVCDQLNGMHIPDFFLGLEPDGHPGTPVPLRRLRDCVQEFVASLDYSECIERVGSDGYDALPSMTFSHDGFHLTIEALPVKPESRNDPDHVPVGHIGPTAMFLDGGKRLRATVRRKARRYGRLEDPYIVAISLPDFHPTPFERMNALFGSLEYVLQDSPGGSGKSVKERRRRDGAWVGHAGPVYRRVSAVLLVPMLTPWTFSVVEPVLVHNAWARYPLVEFTTLISQHIPQDGRMVESSGCPPHELLNLPPGFPGILRES